MPPANFIFGGTDSNRTVRILSGSNQFGSTTITLFVSDGTNVASTNFALTVLRDTDGDGIPDAYETANGMNPNNPADAAKDFDGDGMTNLQEYLAGTDPNDSRNFLRIISVALVPPDAVISFSSVSNKLYHVQGSTNIALSFWTNVATNLPGTGSTVDVTNSNAAAKPDSAYRVRLLP